MPAWTAMLAALELETPSQADQHSDCSHIERHWTNSRPRTFTSPVNNRNGLTFGLRVCVATPSAFLVCLRPLYKVHAISISALRLEFLIISLVGLFSHIGTTLTACFGRIFPLALPE
ncbi:hypothetical protein PHLCEN_2v5945 [Hermanssonia centrifuga]|uniref:Uncharacterized protein n=1 Tax=Hermanssonia centrifuga TaxID=98765 RepID=A0A2R6P0X4_9APHY|nr:hypothetical protein PHLCEN_2v5945 [Hermanssonia centrifuga]